ncbi:MAG: HAMP domain-containing histidine kinase, partial [Alphaproteobacteria bacterium]|nr:HAMP domain-containing histidine kinase [Alphaproteobacteria bacterium]
PVPAPAPGEATALITALRSRLAQESLRAEAASQVKAEFLSHMSHELRTPLNAIIGFSELMTGELYGPLGHPKYAEYASDIRDSGHRLLEMIDRILELATLETGRMPLAREAVDLNAVLSEFAALIRTRIAESGLTLRQRIDPLPPLEGDRRALTQVLLHLVSNAIRYTPRGGTVTLGARSAGGRVVLTVSDTGIGIAPEDLARIGRPFEQFGPRNERDRPGLGLGLALSRLLVEAHGGQLEVRSRLGSGTQVRVSLPLARARAQTADTRA